MAASSLSSSAYNRLQAAAAAFGEKLLPIPEIVVIGGNRDGKSSVVEGLLGFRFNLHCASTRRPLVLQMVHDPAAVEPRCRFQEEDSEEYGSPMVMATAIADLIKQRTESHLRKVQAAVSSKPIVIRAEYAHCPSFTIIDTPGLVLNKAKRGEPESTPDEIRSMVKSLATPPHRLLLFVQQSSVKWCSSIWLDTLKEIDPAFRRTMIVISMFDNLLKEINTRCEVDNFLSAHGYLGGNIHPFAVALPKDCETISNEEFRRKICQADTDVLCHLRDNVKGGFNDEKHGSYAGFSCLNKCLESELHKRYKEAAPATLKLLEQRCTEVSMELTRLDAKLQATSDVSQLRRWVFVHASDICTHLEEQMHSRIDSWPGINMPVKPAYSGLKLYGCGAITRLMLELCCAAYSMECPQVSREQVANKILPALAARSGSIRLTEAAAEIARAAAQSWFAPLIDTACDRIAFLLKSCFDLAMERKRNEDSRSKSYMDSQIDFKMDWLQCHSFSSQVTMSYHHNVEDMDTYVVIVSAFRCSYYKFVEELSKQCKQIVHEDLDLVCRTIGYDNDFLSGINGSVENSMSRFNWFTGDTSFELADQQNMTPPTNKGNESKEVLRESQLTVPKMPSPDLPSGILCGKNKHNGTPIDGGPRKRLARMAAYTSRNHRNHHNSMIGDDMGSKSGSSYSTICTIFAQYFAKMRETLVEKIVPFALNSEFLTPCREMSFLDLGFDFCTVGDDKLMDMFVASGAVDAIKNERQSLLKRQKILLSCLNEFKKISDAL